MSALLAALLLAPTTPAPGSKLRTQILDGLRPVIEREVKRPVKFQIDWFKVEKDWAFLMGRPLQKDGKRVDYRGTKYAQAVKDGVFDDGFSAIMRQSKGKWRPVEWSLGATDVPWDGAWTRHKISRQLFPGG